MGAVEQPPGTEDWLTGGVTLRGPHAAERKACAYLLPELLPRTADARPCVAVAGRPERIVGAVAVPRRRPRACDDGLEFEAQVVPPRRRAGVGRRLVDHVVAIAAAEGFDHVAAFPWLDVGSEGALALEAMGFTAFRHQYEYGGLFRDVVGAMAPLLDEVRAHGWIPESARVVPLTRVPPETITDFHLRFFEGDRQQFLRDLAGVGTERYDLTHSFGLLLDEQLIGYTLGRVLPQQQLCQFDYTAIEPDQRLSWANLWLRHAAAERLVAAGIEHYRYRALDQHADTQRVFRRVKAKHLRTRLRFRRPVGPRVI